MARVLAAHKVSSANVEIILDAVLQFWTNHRLIKDAALFACHQFQLNFLQSRAWLFFRQITRMLQCYVSMNNCYSILQQHDRLCLGFFSSAGYSGRQRQGVSMRCGVSKMESVRMERVVSNPI